MTTTVLRRTTPARGSRPAGLVSIGDHDHFYTVYTYIDRSATGPEEIFKDFKGYLQADAYSAMMVCTTRRDRRGRVPDARGESMRPGRRTRNDPISAGVTACSMTSKATRKPRDRRLRGVRRVSAWCCETSDRGRSSTSFHACWKPTPKVLPKSLIRRGDPVRAEPLGGPVCPLEPGFLEPDNAMSRAAVCRCAGPQELAARGSDKEAVTAAKLMSP